MAIFELSQKLHQFKITEEYGNNLIVSKRQLSERPKLNDNY